VPGDGPRLAVAPVLAPARAEEQQDRKGAGRTDQVDHRRAGEVLHAEARAQPATAEDPVRPDRVDQRGEDDRVDDVDAELDALERRAPHDRERHGAEDELEEPERLDGDRAVLEGDQREVRAGVGAGQEEPVRPDDRVAFTEGERKADRVEHQRGDREVHEDLRDHGADVLSSGEADLEEREAGLHEHDEDARHQDPNRVDADGLRQVAVVGKLQGGSIRERGRRHRERDQQREQRASGPARTSHPSLLMES
jgi:hypothetical protein